MLEGCILIIGSILGLIYLAFLECFCRSSVIHGGSDIKTMFYEYVSNFAVQNGYFKEVNLPAIDILYNFYEPFISKCKTSIIKKYIQSNKNKVVYTSFWNDIQSGDHDHIRNKLCNYTNKQSSALKKVSQYEEFLKKEIEAPPNTHTSKYNVFIFWHSLPSRIRSAYLDLCIETIQKNSELNLIQLDLNNIVQYVDINKIHHSINLEDPSNANYITNRFENLAHVADYLRIQVIYHCGGIWLDADTICLSSLRPLLDNLKNYQFVGFSSYKYKDCPFIFRDVLNGCFASRQNSPVMSQWIDRVNDFVGDLGYKKDFQWNDIGSKILSEILSISFDKLKKSKIKIYFSEASVMPFHWANVEDFFKCTPLIVNKVVKGKCHELPLRLLQENDLISPTYFVILYNHLIQKKYPAFCQADKDTVLNDTKFNKLNIVQLLKYALNQK